MIGWKTTRLKCARTYQIRLLRPAAPRGAYSSSGSPTNAPARSDSTMNVGVNKGFKTMRMQAAHVFDVIFCNLLHPISLQLEVQFVVLVFLGRQLRTVAALQAHTSKYDEHQPRGRA